MTRDLRAPAGRRAVRVRHGPGGPERDARACDRAAARRRRSARLAKALDGLADEARADDLVAQGVARRRASRSCGACTCATKEPIRRSSSRTARSPTCRRSSRRVHAALLVPHARACPGRRGGSVEAIGRGEDAEDVVARERRTQRGPAAVGTRARLVRRQLARHAAVPTGASTRPGDRIDGPAIIAEANATTVVDPGWQAEVTSLDQLVLNADRAAQAAPGDRHRRSTP